MSVLELVVVFEYMLFVAVVTLVDKLVVVFVEFEVDILVELDFFEDNRIAVVVAVQQAAFVVLLVDIVYLVHYDLALIVHTL